MNTAAKPRSLVTWFFNPFIYIAGWQSLLIGVAAILVAGYIGSLSNTHFDGVLDLSPKNCTRLKESPQLGRIAPGGLKCEENGSAKNRLSGY